MSGRRLFFQAGILAFAAVSTVGCANLAHTGVLGRGADSCDASCDGPACTACDVSEDCTCRSGDCHECGNGCGADGGDCNACGGDGPRCRRGGRVGLRGRLVGLFCGRRSNAIPETLPLGSTVRAHYQVMETNGEAADFIFHRHDFVGQTAQLTPDGRDKVLEVAVRMKSAPFPVLVERGRNNSDPELDMLRRNLVAQILTEYGVPDADGRTIVSPSYGRGYNAIEAETTYYRHLLQGAGFNNGGGSGGGFGGGGFGGGFGGGGFGGGGFGGGGFGGGGF